MEVMELLTQAVEQNAADIFLVPGMPFSYKIGGRIICQGEEKIMPDEMDQMITRIYEIAKNRSMERILSHGDDDFSFAIPGVSRFRANIFRQRGSLAAIIRVITFDLPDFRNLNIPQVVIDISRMTKGFVLVTGPAGSGKSTTLACIIDQINKTRNVHVITLEDPIEYLHNHKKAMVNQREIGLDTHSYSNALRAALREDPDVILVGEMRDLETISTAITAAETGHLVLSTLHTIGAASTIDRIVDVFPPHQQQQIRVQLSMVLESVISQQLIPTADRKSRVAAFEVMHSTPAIKNLIREAKSPQINSTIQTSKKQGMQTMDDAIFDLYMKGDIDKENAVSYARDGLLMEKRIDNAF